MAWMDGSTSATETHNRAGCPYLNQTGSDAVRDWAHVLANIDTLTLAPDLQDELQQLRMRCAGADRPASA